MLRTRRFALQKALTGRRFRLILVIRPLRIRINFFRTGMIGTPTGRLGVQHIYSDLHRRKYRRQCRYGGGRRRASQCAHGTSTRSRRNGFTNLLRCVCILAEATLRSTASTASEAKRAYDIASVRFQQGISTEVELEK